MKFWVFKKFTYLWASTRATEGSECGAEKSNYMRSKTLVWILIGNWVAYWLHVYLVWS